MKDFYKETEELTGLTIDQIRFAERHMIAYQKLIEKPILTEEQFQGELKLASQKMTAGVSFETIIEIKWPKSLLTQYGVSGKAIGPGFMKTQLDYSGRHVIYRHKSDPKH